MNTVVYRYPSIVNSHKPHVDVISTFLVYYDVRLQKLPRKSAGVLIYSRKTAFSWMYIMKMENEEIWKSNLFNTVPET